MIKEFIINITRNVKGTVLRSRNRKKGTHNNPKSMGHSKTALRQKSIALQAYLKKQEKSQINNNTPPKRTSKTATNKP